MTSEYVIGLISDTHGLMRPEALAALAGVAQIIHAGDVGGSEIVAALREIAPVTVVRGNTDNSPWARTLPLDATVQVGAVKIYVIHDLHQLDIHLGQQGYRVVISGHTHRPVAEERDGVLFVNPGAAGPRRFHLPTTVALLRVRGEEAAAEHIELPIQ